MACKCFGIMKIIGDITIVKWLLWYYVIRIITKSKDDISICIKLLINHAFDILWHLLGYDQQLSAINASKVELVFQMYF